MGLNKRRVSIEAGNCGSVRSDRVDAGPQGFVSETEICWVTRETVWVGEVYRACGRLSGRMQETEQWCGAERSGATPTGLSEDGSVWHQDLMARATGSA
jgi:hypothetical protein